MTAGPYISRRGSFSALAAITTTSVAYPLHAQRPADAPKRDVATVSDYGARGDGVSDDTRAFQAAVATGLDVYVPGTESFYKISHTIALAANGQHVHGVGSRSRIVQTGAGANANVFVVQHDDCHFEMLHLTPGISVSDLTHGWGILIVGARRASVNNCRVSGSRRGGIALADACDCRITNNYIYDSVVRGGDFETQSETGHDIYLMGNSCDNIVASNHCQSGSGTGVGCQTATPTKQQRGNVISGNIISGHPCYGIMIYGNEFGNGIHGLLIEGNSIDEITGSVRTDGLTRFYGCGIYIASANDFIVSSNRVTRTNIDRRLPFSGSALPAGIGISGFGNGVVTGNLIDDCYHGIASVQASVAGKRGDRTVICDNIVRGCDGTGVLLLDSVGATIRGNQLIGDRGSQGVYASPVSARHRGTMLIADNYIIGFGVGIEVRGGVPYAHISGNEVLENSGNGIYSGAETSMVQSNRISGDRGIVLSPAAKQGLCHDNIIEARFEPIEIASPASFSERGNITALRGASTKQN